MPSLFHVIDEESLSKNPNLKFDPQNPSAHLQPEHPKFQELKEGLKLSNEIAYICENGECSPKDVK